MCHPTCMSVCVAVCCICLFVERFPFFYVTFMVGQYAYAANTNMYGLDYSLLPFSTYEFHSFHFILSTGWILYLSTIEALHIPSFNIIPFIFSIHLMISLSVCELSVSVLHCYTKCMPSTRVPRVPYCRTLYVSVLLCICMLYSQRTASRKIEHFICVIQFVSVRTLECSNIEH